MKTDNFYHIMYGAFLDLQANNREKSDRYKGQLERLQHARTFRSCTMDFGRITGKTTFALEMLKEYPDTMIFFHNQDARDQVRRTMNAHRNGTSPFAVTYVSADRFRASNGSRSPHAQRVLQAKVVIFDEPGMMNKADIEAIMANCDYDVNFIFLGSWL